MSDIEILTQAIISATEESNNQSMHNTADMRKAFGPKLDALTKAINKSSESSDKLTRMIMYATIAGVFVASIGVGVAIADLFC